MDVRPHGQLDSHWTNFHKTLYLSFLSFFPENSVKKIQVSLTSDNNKYVTLIPTYMYGILSELFLELEIFQIEVV